MKEDIFFYRDTSSASARRGPLQDMRIVIQPNIAVQGWPTEAGSPALKKFVALEDATVVERLRKGGAVIVGSTRMSELGFGLAGNRSAAAVTDGAADIALMTDSMGESRLSAFYAALYGFKPSFGLVSRFGLIGLVPSMECFSMIARRPEEMGRALKVMAGRDEKDFSLPDEELPDFSPVPHDPGKTSIGFIKEAVAMLPDAQITIFNKNLEELRKAGFEVCEVSLPEFHLFALVHRIVGSVEASSSAGKYDGVRYGHRTTSARNWNEMYIKSRSESFSPLLKTYLFQGAFFQFEEFEAFKNACRIRARLVKDMENLFKDVEFLALPTRNSARLGAGGATASIKDVYHDFSFTLAANITGQPAIHLPQGEGDASNPGLQLAGRRLSDARLLSIAGHIKKIRGGGR